jgi:hypothetical protein
MATARTALEPVPRVHHGFLARFVQTVRRARYAPLSRDRDEPVRFPAGAWEAWHERGTT